MGNKFQETKLLDIVRRFQIHFSLSGMFQKGAELKFSSQNIGLGKNFREKKLLDIIERLQIYFPHSSIFQKGAGLKFIS